MSEKSIIIKVPDIGSYENVDIIDICVKLGEKINIDDALITLETDKATMDVPSTTNGIVNKIFVSIGDKVSQGSPIIEVLTSNDKVNILDEDNNNLNKQIIVDNTQNNNQVNINNIQNNQNDNLQDNSLLIKDDNKTIIYAGPAVRKLARELGVDLRYVQGTGNKNRIVSQDLKDYVKNNFHKVFSQENNLFKDTDLPSVTDFSKYGDVEIRKLNRIQKISSKNLYKNWINIPHVTQHADSDFTCLEEFRKTLNNEWAKDNLKCSPLVLIIKAVSHALKIFPEFNSSLVGDEIILKKYYNIGFAADTVNGLVVPVIKDVNHKGLKEIALELKELSSQARLNKLSISQMQGATFTISSLGGIGGNYFTPIINSPEVAILGVCKNNIQPIYNGQEFVPRLICPLSLSYDHRVIDGALACRFITYLSDLLLDIRKILV